MHLACEFRSPLLPVPLPRRETYPNLSSPFRGQSRARTPTFRPLLYNNPSPVARSKPFIMGTYRLFGFHSCRGYRVGDGLLLDSVSVSVSGRAMLFDLNVGFYCNARYESLTLERRLRRD